MIKNILNTTIVRLINAAITFIILLMNARMLGAENLGTIGLIVLNVTIVLMLNNLFGGGALVYLVPRHPFSKIRRISYLWAICSAFIAFAIFWIFKIEPVEYHYKILLLSIIMALGAVNQNLLLGKEKIRAFNLLSLMQYLILLVSLLILFFVLNNQSVEAYIHAMFIAWGVTWILGSVYILKLKTDHVSGEGSLIRDMMKYGVMVQLANLAQFFNYRIAYFFIEKMLGRASLGIYDIGTKLSEGIWLLGKSISMVQYARISNSDDKENNINLTLTLFKFTFLTTLLLVSVLVLIPESVYLSIFGAEFAGLRIVIIFLGPGIVFVAGTMILAHFFAGTGRHYVNTITSVIGLTTITLLCIFIIPEWGLKGAALAASLSYAFSFIFNLLVFILKTGTPIRSLLIQKSDIQLVKSLIASVFTKSSR